MTHTDKARRAKPVKSVAKKPILCECGHQKNQHGAFFYDKDGFKVPDTDGCVGGLDICACTKFHPKKNRRGVK